MDDARIRRSLAATLARAFLSGRWDAEQMAERGAGSVDHWPSWMSGLALHVAAVYRSAPVHRRSELTYVIESFLTARRVRAVAPEPPQIGRGLSREPSTFAHGWPIAAIESVAGLAETLELSIGQLAWLADVRGLERTVTASKLRNYRYRTVSRRSGLPRVIEAPKARLKEIQRWVLHEILDDVPAHPSAQGFVRGRSVITHAQRHAGQDTVLRLDVKDFFASITAGRIYGIFHTLGYEPAVAHALTGLCTNAVPVAVWRQVPPPGSSRLVQAHFWLGRQLATPHLPQGAPTSPALANLAAFRLDRRLSGVAATLGLNYSRYADDLTFSGPARLRRQSAQLQAFATKIAREEGFVLNRDKSSMRTAARRQSICGIVVNAHPNIARDEYDRLKAILHNAARDGPGSQNRSGTPDLRAHLHGRIAWIESLNPGRGEKLRQRLAEIDWGNAPAADP
ncbi:MAG TPA: reverse transcriptase family protein [Solirubrobacteraceae bacterium]